MSVDHLVQFSHFMDEETGGPENPKEELEPTSANSRVNVLSNQTLPFLASASFERFGVGLIGHVCANKQGVGLRGIVG